MGQFAIVIRELYSEVYEALSNKQDYVMPDSLLKETRVQILKVKESLYDDFKQIIFTDIGTFPLKPFPIQQLYMLPEKKQNILLPKDIHMGQTVQVPRYIDFGQVKFENVKVSEYKDLFYIMENG